MSRDGVVRRLLAGVVVLGLATGCALPLPEGVRSAGQVQAEQQEPAGIQVLPPGPQDGATAVELVEGFLRAQSSPGQSHAVARQFLAPGTPWDDEALVIVYRASSPTVAPDLDQPNEILVRLETVARISGDGSYRGESRTLTERYAVAPDPAGQLRLTAVPPGLRLTSADRELSFRPYEVDFLGLSATGAPTGRLVSDRVFLPVTAEPAAALVGSLLRGPSVPLQGAVASAVPVGTTLASPVRVDAGVVTVDLSEEVLRLDARARQRLAAQLVWTLHPVFPRLRLLVEGRPLEVQGAGEVQGVSDWPGFDPVAAVEDAPLLYLQERTLRNLDGALESSEATRGGTLFVDQAASSPLAGTLGLLTRLPDQPDEVRIGPASGPFGDPVLTGTRLGSLSWGPGDQGLWVLASASGQTGPVVWLVPGPDAPTAGSPVSVAYDQPPDAPGRLTDLRVSRDGVRIALVFGSGPDRRLHLGRIEPFEGGHRIAGIVAIAPALTDVTDVAWEDGTSLAVLAADPNTAGLLPVSVAVDGSSSTPVQRGGLSGTPVSLAAAPGRPLTVATVQDGRSRLFRDNGALFRLQQDGSEPFYPG
jgi:hypothetical protein